MIESPDNAVKVLWIIPGDEKDPLSMVYVKKLLNQVSSKVQLRVFYLTNRLSIIQLLRDWIKLKKLTKEFRPDWIHSQYGSIVAFISWTLGQKFVVTFRGSDVNGDPHVGLIRGFFTKFLSLFVAQRADFVICVSMDLASKVLRPDATCMPSPIDLDIFKPIDKSFCRQKLNLTQEKVLVGFTGGTRPLKRRDLAKKAAEKCGFMLVDIIKVEPEQMPIWLNAMDLIILTSEREGSPNIIRESLACGIPVVSVRVGDVERWISRDINSRIVNGSVDELAEAMSDIVASNSPHVRSVDFSDVSCGVYIQKLINIYNT